MAGGGLRWFLAHMPGGITVAGFVAVVVELGLGLWGAFYVMQGFPAPYWVSVLFVAVAVVFLVLLLTSFQWARPGRFDAHGNFTPSSPRTPQGRMVLVVFFGYMLVVAGAVVAVSRLVTAQEPVTSGLVTNTYDDRQLLVAVQGPSSLTIARVTSEPVPLWVNVTLAFVGAPSGSFNGTATFTVERLDSPLALGTSQTAGVGLGSANPRAQVALLFDPVAGFASQAYNIFYSIRYNLTVPTLGNFSGSLKDSIAISVESVGLTSTWYLFFIFAGILTSFWWRVSNGYLEGTFTKPDREDLRAAYLLLLPIFSSVIALVIFQQFEKPSTPVDFLTSLVTGFVYGFFWESATEKIGRTIKTAIM